MRILIVKMSSLGDIIHAFPVLEYVKQCQPHCQIDWVVEHSFAELVRAHPLIHRVVSVQTRKWRSQFFYRSSWKEMASVQRELREASYDLVLDLQGNIKSGIITVLAKSSVKVGFGYASISEWPNLLATNKKYSPPPGGNIREDYLFLAQKAMGDVSQSVERKGVQLTVSSQEKIKLESIVDQLKEISALKVLVCAGSNWPNKQLSRHTLQDFLDVFSRHLHAHFLLIWGNEDEKRLVEEIAAHFPQESVVMDRLSLPILQNVMRHVDLVLAMDSLPLHLAGITSTPTYSIFGPSLAKKYKPMGKEHVAFQGKCPYGKTFDKRCNMLRTCKTGACMKQLEGKELFAHFYAWWRAL